jgi:hypothetical protein
VVGVLNDLAVLTAENAAKVGVVGAKAERTSAELKNAAKAQGLVLLQVERERREATLPRRREWEASMWPTARGAALPFGFFGH